MVNVLLFISSVPDNKIPSLFSLRMTQTPAPLPSQRKEKKFLKNMNDKNVFLIEINPKASDTLMVHVNSCCVLVGNIG